MDQDVNNLVNAIKIITKWFYNNSVLSHPSKFQFMFLGKDTTRVNIKINNSIIRDSECVKLLEVEIQRKVKFKNNVNL